MLSDHNICIEKCVNATSESERDEALKFARDYIEWSVKESKCFYLACLLQHLHGNMKNIAPEILLECVRLMKPASDGILGWEKHSGEIETYCGN